VTVTLAFTNESTRQCSLVGYPKMRMLNASDRDIPTTERHYISASLPVILVVRPGQRAYFEVHFSDGAAFQGQPGYRRCPTSAKLRLTPPRHAQALTLSTKKAQITPYGAKAGDCGLVFVSPIASSGLG
jgi:hypothetical protein